MMKSRECDGAPLGPGAANDDQGRFFGAHTEVLTYRGVGHVRAHNLLGFLQRRHRGQVRARRHLRKILLEAVGRKTRQHVAILDLDRRAVFAVNQEQVEDVRTLLHVPVDQPTEGCLIDRAISVLSVIILGFIAYLLSPKTKGRPTDPSDDQAEPPPEGETEAKAADEEPAGQETTTA